jgi:undecaprenyl-diphosphatase
MVFGWQDQGLAFDVAVHLGSLSAVLWYFRPEVARMSVDFFRSMSPNPGEITADGRLAWMIVLSTLPVVFFGLLMKGLVETDLRSAVVIATTTIVFGLYLWWFDAKGARERDEYSIAWKDALIIGLMQAIAIIPGTSRSGITMAAGLMLGLTREAASRYSFLLSIPTIAMSGVLVTAELIEAGDPVDWYALSLGATLSFLAAWACIHLFLKMIERIGMLPFVLYRLLLGGLIFLLVFI